jgi:epoxyqueuosine reductase
VIDAQKIITLGKELGIDEIKITTAEPFGRAAARIIQQKKAGLYLNSERWHRRNIEEFCNVRSALSTAKSIVAACQCYLTDEPIDTGAPGDPHGLIARYTWRNHYSDLKKRLQILAMSIKERQSVECVVYSNGVIAEKPIAERSGIGYYGKNSLIINRRFGSLVVLGEIVTNADIEPDSAGNADCGECLECIEACPTRAIIEPYVIDRRRCIQALTNWYGVLPLDISSVWENRLYGCTTCQDVCPANHDVKAGRPRTDIGYVGQSISLLDILTMDETQYRKKFAGNQMTARWINFKAIQRNAIIALGNVRDKKTLPTLEKLTKSGDPVHAHSAQWAINNF